jgi:hypothetical protein
VHLDQHVHPRSARLRQFRGDAVVEARHDQQDAVSAQHPGFGDLPRIEQSLCAARAGALPRVLRRVSRPWKNGSSVRTDRHTTAAA